jgi:hypothetical protein
MPQMEGRMSSFLESIWYRAAEVPSQTCQWFYGLNREEWFVVLAITFACGFISLLGFQSRRL